LSEPRSGAMKTAWDDPWWWWYKYIATTVILVLFVLFLKGY
jgi:hypothetical protein